MSAPRKQAELPTGIRRNGDRFQAYGRRDGKKAYLGTFDSLREAIAAQRKHAVTSDMIADGELPAEADAKRTFGESVTKWLAALEKAGQRSHDEYKSRVELYMMAPFRDVPLVKFRKSDIVKWRDDLGLRVSAATVNTNIRTISSAFSWFVGRDWLAANPCFGVRQLKVDGKVFPWIQSTEQITKLLGELRWNLRTLCAVLLGTGLRLDEALFLRWDDIDLEHRLIVVHRGRKGTTKSGHARRVPIFDSVLAVLKAMKLERGANTLLWPGRKLGQPLAQHSVRKPFKQALERCGLPPTLRLHDLRHSFASLYLVDGGDIFKLSRILGHSSVAITERTYAHLKPDAFETDYGRVAFRMPHVADVIPLRAEG